jgi:hypothetical protein
MRRKSSYSVLAAKFNFYAQWRRRNRAELREEAGPPSERLLQAVWFHQRITRSQLKTTDGRAVQIFHPGFWNREAGPDFKGALLRFDEEMPATGDIEIDLSSAGWRAHGHDKNPNFKNVKLHVVWQKDEPGEIPTLVLRNILDSPLPDLTLWLSTDAAPDFPPELQGNCCAPLRALNADRRQQLLQQAGLVRLQSKAAQFKSRARQGGWEQALWEALFRALGYKNNAWPMQRLGELRNQLSPPGQKTSLVQLQARLLGVAGLLPDQLSRPQSAPDQYVRRLWDSWWRERSAFLALILPRSLWRFNNLRPANHPERRLALAAHWLARADLVPSIERWCTANISNEELLQTLQNIFLVQEDEFWSWHWTLKSKRLNAPQPLIGPTRVTDLAINVILPWLWMRAVEGNNDVLQEKMESRFLAWPSAEDNSVLRLARNRLLGGTSAREVKGAAAQQGLLQIVRDFCEKSNAVCDECRFPELVRDWK